MATFVQKNEPDADQLKVGDFWYNQQDSVLQLLISDAPKLSWLDLRERGLFENQFTFTEADQDIDVTSFTDVLGLAFFLQANTKYKFEYSGGYQSDVTTTGARFSVNGPASPAFLLCRGIYAAGANTFVAGANNAYDTALNVTGTGPGATSLPFYVGGFIETGASPGHLVLRVQSEIASPSFVRIKQGAIGSLVKLGP